MLAYIIISNKIPDKSNEICTDTLCVVVTCMAKTFLIPAIANK